MSGDAVVVASGRRGVSIVAIVTALATIAATTSEGRPVGAATALNANGSITCTHVTGTLRFVPPLTSGGMQPSVSTAELALSDCEQNANTNVFADRITAKVVAKQTLAHNDCANATTESATANVSWNAAGPASALAPTSLNANGTTSLIGPNNVIGLALNSPTATGSYAGASDVTLFSDMTQSAAAAACGTKGLTGWNVSDGSVRFGPHAPSPVFTSAPATTFSEGDPGSFTVAVSDAAPVALRWERGDAPRGNPVRSEHRQCNRDTVGYADGRLARHLSDSNQRRRHEWSQHDPGLHPYGECHFGDRAAHHERRPTHRRGWHCGNHFRSQLRRRDGRALRRQRRGVLRGEQQHYHRDHAPGIFRRG